MTSTLPVVSILVVTYHNVHVLICLGKEILVGLTTRTDEAGIRALQKAFPNYPVRMVDMENLARKAYIAGKFCIVCFVILFCYGKGT